jgi:hypothetical protein
MLSVISCSKDPARAESSRRHYSELLQGVEYELLSIRDPRSLAAAYNQAIETSRGEILIFTHDDITFLEPESWFARLTAHLGSQDIVGLAGTTRLLSAAWAQAGPPDTYGLIAERDGRIAPYRVLVCATPRPLIGGIQALDGVFLAVHRRVVERVRFDPTHFDGFHCYDADFTFTAYHAGFRLAVAADLPALHASRGSFDDTWQIYAQRFAAKHGSRLPQIRPRPFQHAMVYVGSAAEALDVMHGVQADWAMDAVAPMAKQRAGPTR